MSKSSFTLSLPTAILININIMLGAGIFLNTVPLAKFAGALSPLAYLMVGIMMLPLIMSIARLLKLFPGGSFYTFGALGVHPLIGFISAWSYFTGKLASATLMIHFFSQITTSLIPAFSGINPFALDSIIITLFAGLNSLNMRIGSTIQYLFLSLKSTPILFVILAGLYYVSGAHFTPEQLLWHGVPPTIPLVIYAFTGFEASCSLSQHIYNPERNAPRAIFYSFGLVLVTVCTYQAIFYGVLGSKLTGVAHYFEAIPLFIGRIIQSIHTQNTVSALLQLAVAASALGGAYGILFSNNWNLHVLAQNNHLLFSKTIQKLNAHRMPYVCVAIEALFCFWYLWLSGGNNVRLQHIAAFGSVIGYTISIIALIVTLRKQYAHGMSIAYAALASCLGLMALCINGFISQSIIPLYAFLGVIACGIAMYAANTRSHN